MAIHHERGHRDALSVLPVCVIYREIPSVKTSEIPWNLREQGSGLLSQHSAAPKGITAETALLRKAEEIWHVNQKPRFDRKALQYAVKLRSTSLEQPSHHSRTLTPPGLSRGLTTLLRTVHMLQEWELEDNKTHK